MSFWQKTANIATTIGIFIVIYQLNFATDQLRFSHISNYEKLSAGCETHVRSPEAPYSAEQLHVWNELCASRILSQKILINDLLRNTATESESLVNLKAVNRISIQLEDALVRELKEKASDYLQKKNENCDFVDDELQRAQEVFQAVYMLDKPRPEWWWQSMFGRGKNLKEQFEDERIKHSERLLDDPEHNQAFLDFGELVDHIGKPCK
jgi:hypothetical protein